MRLNRLDLIRYGKFDGQSIDFPAAKQDFHLVVGANEAGKSTLRSAILDLLFGIPTRSPLGFLHPLSELRLGASIANRTGAIEFHRAKAQKQTLRTPSDALLPDNALVPFLGTADRKFFDQMFGLDHTRLVHGGNSILSAENDVGQVLFQSAAGVASLGKIRDALLSEAEGLWAPKKAANRAYYIAAEQLEKAGALLKEATVRTKVWLEANGKLETIREAIAAERTQLQALGEKRNRLERVRRTAPFLRALREIEQRLAALGDVIELPEDAAVIVATAERELATAEQLLKLRNQEVEAAQQELAHIVVNEAVLAAAADITALEERRLQYTSYDRDIGLREREVALLWQDISEACAQLGWPHDTPEELAACLPTLLVRREIGRLALASSGFIQALRAAEQAERTKRSEIEAVQKQLAELQTGAVPPALRAALEKARSLGEPDAAIQKQQGTVAKAKATLEAAMQALGPWRKPVSALETMQPPPENRLSLLIQERQTLHAERKAANKQREAQEAEVARVGMEVDQFKDRHRPTAQEAVMQARRDRDASWSAIKAGEVAPEAAAPQFEAQVQLADVMADARLDDVEEAAGLQSLQQRLEREQLNLTKITEQVSRLNEEIRQFDERWSEQASMLDIAGMELDNVAEWLAKREKVLAAAAAFEDAQISLDQGLQEVEECRQGLISGLRAASQPAAESDRLASLRAQAEDYIQAVDSARVRRETLSAQLTSARSLSDALKRSTEGAQADADGWNDAWEKALAKAGLPGGSPIGAAEAALELISGIEENLSKLRQIRVERIDAMKADQQRFAEDATRVARAVLPQLQGLSATEMVQEMVKRLTQARDAHAKSARLEETLRIASQQAQAAQATIETASAAIRPLLERAGVGSRESLSAVIARSNTRRALISELGDAQDDLLEGSDGLTRAQIEKEVDAIDLSGLAAELERVNADHADAVNRQAALTGDLQEANQALAVIGGSGAAALAEAQRQEALAQMSDAAERYIRVYTAGRLLRWSIDRYREEKQGPLLARAGAIFATLTKHSFQKLVVDFEAEPMTLEGLRADGNLVGVSGMSDGTRDQLYLALRLAALELHLDQASPLPFIADDLFINYDDGRSEAGFEALAALSEKTQVIFLSHHDHLISTVQKTFGQRVNVVQL